MQANSRNITSLGALNRNGDTNQLVAARLPLIIPRLHPNLPKVKFSVSHETKRLRCHSPQQSITICISWFREIKWDMILAFSLTVTIE